VTHDTTTSATNATMHTTPAPRGAPVSTTTLHLHGPAAAALLGISLRTLQRRAELGQIARHTLGRRTLYALTPAVQSVPRWGDRDPMHDTASDTRASVAVTQPAAPAPQKAVTGDSTTSGHATPAPAELVSALVEAVERATRAEVEVERLRVELATARKGWARAHAGWQVATTALDRLTSV
jgi:hypothetical protein